MPGQHVLFLDYWCLRSSVLYENCPLYRLGTLERVSEIVTYRELIAAAEETAETEHPRERLRALETTLRLGVRVLPGNFELVNRELLGTLGVPATEELALLLALELGADRILTTNPRVYEDVESDVAFPLVVTIADYLDEVG